jgi:hypothetical protein
MPFVGYLQHCQYTISCLFSALPVYNLLLVFSIASIPSACFQYCQYTISCLFSALPLYHLLLVFIACSLRLIVSEGTACGHGLSSRADSQVPIFSPEDGDNILLRNVLCKYESTRLHNPEHSYFHRRHNHKSHTSHGHFYARISVSNQHRS